MAFEKIKVHEIDLEKRKENFKNKVSKEECKYVFDFLRSLSLGEINKGIAVGEVRQVKYLDMLYMFFTYFKKPISKLNLEDMRDFIADLTNDKITKQNGEPYSAATKQDIKMSVRTYLKWRLPKRYPELTDWIDTRMKKKTPEYLSEQEIEKLYNNCKSPSERFLIAILFDSGARIEEFLNIRFEDVISPTETFPYYRIEIKSEYSKTEGRTIGLYWKHSTEAINFYLSDCDKSENKAQVYPKDYDAVRMFLTRLGSKVLGKRVHAHLLRKSSATYYASKLNRQQLCVRYGWRFSSDMPDVYIKRAGIEEDKVKDVVLNEDLTKMKKESEEIKTKLGLTKDQLSTLSEENHTLREGMKKLVKEFDEIKKLKKAYSLIQARSK